MQVVATSLEEGLKVTHVKPRTKVRMSWRPANPKIAMSARYQVSIRSFNGMHVVATSLEEGLKVTHVKPGTKDPRWNFP